MKKKALAKFLGISVRVTSKKGNLFPQWLLTGKETGISRAEEAWEYYSFNIYKI